MVLLLVGIATAKRKVASRNCPHDFSRSPSPTYRRPCFSFDRRPIFILSVIASQDNSFHPKEVERTGTKTRARLAPEFGLASAKKSSLAVVLNLFFLCPFQNKQVDASAGAAVPASPPSRPTSAFISDAAATAKAKASAVSASASAALKSKNFSLWGFEVALAFLALLISLILLCVPAAKGLNQLSLLDQSVARAEKAPSSFAPVSSLAISAVLLCPILGALSLFSLGSLLRRRSKSGKGGIGGETSAAAAAAAPSPDAPLRLRAQTRWAAVKKSKSFLPSLVAILLLSSLFSSFVLASAAGGASYSSALTRVAKQATALYDRAKDLVQNRVGGPVRQVDSLGGALPQGTGILKTAFGLLKSAQGSRLGSSLLSPLSDEIASFGRTVGLSDPAAAAELRAAGTPTCAPECLDLSFIPFLSGSKCICDAALLVDVAQRASVAAASFKTATVGAGLLAATHAAMLARGGWAGGVAAGGVAAGAAAF